MDSANNWYALFVVTGEEDKVKERLGYRFRDKLRILVPKRKLKERKDGIWTHNIRLLFPGYVLINGIVGADEYYDMKGVPGLIKLLRTGTCLTPIEFYEMEILNKLVCNNETIGFSDVLLENGRIIVVDGPLVSMEGLITSIDRRKGRAKVMINFMGEQRIVELGISVLQPA